jgi:hypothetical protein
MDLAPQINRAIVCQSVLALYQSTLSCEAETPRASSFRKSGAPLGLVAFRKNKEAVEHPPVVNLP